MSLDFVHPLFLKNMFRKLDLFPHSGKMMEAPTPLGPLERASLNRWTTSVKRSKTPEIRICKQETKKNTQYKKFWEQLICLLSLHK
jgi:hypothetical protein